MASLYVPSGVSSFEVEKPSTGASSLFRGYFDRFALKNRTREEAPVFRCCMSHVNRPTNSAEEPEKSVLHPRNFNGISVQASSKRRSKC